MKAKKKYVIFTAVILVLAVIITCLHIFVFIPDRTDASDDTPETYSFPILAEVYEGEWLVEDMDQSEAVTLGALADILYTIAGEPALEVPKSLAKTPAFEGRDVREVFGKDPLSGESYSDSFIWCLLNGIFYVEGNFELVPDPDDTAAKYNRENYFHDWVVRITEDDEKLVKLANGEYILHSVKPAYSVAGVTEITASDAAVALYRLCECHFGMDMTPFVKKSYSALTESSFRLYDKDTLYYEDGEVISSAVCFCKGSGVLKDEFTFAVFGGLLAEYFDNLEKLENGYYFR